MRFFLVACVVGGCASTTDAPLDSAAFLNRYLHVMESGDETAMRSVHVDDDRFAWFTDGVARYSSVDELIAGRRAFAGAKFKTKLGRVTTVRRANWAAVTSEFRTNLRLPDGQSHEYGGVITWVLEESDATWRVLRGHTSTPTPRGG